MDFNLTVEQQQIREEIKKVCKEFPDAYWREIDSKKAYPGRLRAQTFRSRLARGVDSRGIRRHRPRHHRSEHHPRRDQSLRRRRHRLPRADVHHGHAACATATTSRKNAICPRSPPASCACRPSASPSPTPAPRARGFKPRRPAKATRYLINGQKIFISRVLQSDLMLLLARTTPYDELKDKTRGLSVFIVDLKSKLKESLRLSRST